MIFHEIYGRYYATVARILEEACRGTLTREKLTELSFEKAFSESIMTIPPALTSGRWALLNDNMETPVKNPPKLPLTMLQRRWLKTIIRDDRIRLFVSDEEIQKLDEALGDVLPLLPEDRVVLVYYDRYSDGDDFKNPDYRKNFHAILQALREEKLLKVRFIGAKGFEGTYTIKPYSLEYSVKDDKFRVLTKAHPRTINVGRILECEVLDDYHRGCRIEARGKKEEHETGIKEIELLLTDEKKALERAMLHFSHFRKETERIDDLHYRIFLEYYVEDETELVIRILSFGPRVRVVAPGDFVEKIKERIERQFRYMER